MNNDHKPDGTPSVSSLTYFSTLFLAIIALMLTLMACACTSTSTDAPDDPAKYRSDEISLTLSGSDLYALASSRGADSHDGYQLRYVVSLYSTATGLPGIEEDPQNGAPGNLVERIEQTASTGNTVIFRNVKPGFYFVVIFADYIDADASQNADGSYADKYYDTHSSSTYVTLLASDADIFNNHDLDCFHYCSDGAFEKEDGKALNLTFNLSRCVSRVEVIAQSGSLSSLKDLSVSSYSVMNNLNLVNGAAEIPIAATNKQITLTPPADGNGSNLLFFFYTFNAPYGIPLKGIDFTLHPNEGYAFSNDGAYTIPAATITPEANIIYKVTGNFLSTTESPSKAVDINVTTLTEWSDASQEIPEN